MPKQTIHVPIARNTGQWVHFKPSAKTAPMQIKDPAMWGPYRAFDEDVTKCSGNENGQHAWLDQMRRNWPALWVKSRTCAVCKGIEYG